MSLDKRRCCGVCPRRLTGMVLLASLLFLCLPLPAVCQQSPQPSAKSSASTEPVDPVRYKQAMRLQKQAERFQLHARSYHLAGETKSQEAQKLRADAERLRATTSKYLLPGGQGKSDYKDRLARYRALADQYRAHAARYALHAQERDRIAMESRLELARYQEHCAEYQAHCRQFHHGLDYPHYCPPTRAAHERLAPLANQYMQDRRQLDREEGLLRVEEQKLQQAEQQRAAVEQGLISNAVRRAEEQGMQSLQMEHEQLQRAQADIMRPQHN